MSDTVQLEPGKRVQFFETVIPAAGSQSAAINLYGYALKGVVMPAAFTGATLTLLASDREDGTYLAVFDGGGAAVSLTVAASRYVVLTSAQADAVAGINFLKVASGSTEAAPRSLKIVGTVSTK